MIHEPAEVVAVGKGVVWADCRSRRDCARCAAGQGCGGVLMARMLGTRQHRVRARCADHVEVGDTVRLELAERTILVAAALAYLVPLAGLLTGAVAGDLVAGEAGAMAGGVCGLVLAWRGARFRARRHAGELDPVARRQ